MSVSGRFPTISVKIDVSDDDSTNNNIVNENKQITKTLSEMLKNGDLVPHVSFSSTTCQIIKINY